ncbi:Glycerol-3-phosphate acyltransferase, chloroplastic [Frankliniella fusca]|uniref:Glycerol-3-phosphate acyltransferase, chloroplastic n=1 Tax=Frankliniella fusca TaxID=407009 RepID=A0AAE1LRS3_9NEOP|nr:Glycerol-3-phosphate acyltransferase, chloroplastic [Frankliniella fusca]
MGDIDIPRKRVCRIETPKSFKSNGKDSSTPVRKTGVSKDLRKFFPDVDAVLSPCVPSTTNVKILVPARFNFMKMSFISFLERTGRRRSIFPDGVAKCVDDCQYCSKTNTVTVTFKSADIAISMRQLGKMTFLNNSIEFLNVDEEENNHSVHEDATLLDVGISDDESDSDVQKLCAIDDKDDDEMWNGPNDNGVIDDGKNDDEMCDGPNCNGVIDDGKNNDEILDGLNNGIINDELVHKLSQSFHDATIADMNNNDKPVTPAFDISADLHARSLIVSNLTEGFPLDFLRYTLHNMIVKEGLCSQETDSILVVSEETEDKALVEVCCHTTVNFKYKLSQFVTSVINNVHDFLRFTLNSILEKDGVGTKGIDSILKISLENGTAVVPVTEEKFVHSLLMKKSFPFMGENVSIISHNYPITKVLLKNLRKGFDLDYLRFTLKIMFEKEQNVFSNDMDPISVISTVEGGAEVLVELSEEKFAKFLIMKKRFPFMGGEVDIVAAAEQQLNPAEESLALSLRSQVNNKIFLTNLDEDCPTDFLHFTLNSILEKDGVCTKGMDCIVEVSLENGVAVVELTADKFKEYLLMKKSFPFMGRSVCVNCEISENHSDSFVSLVNETIHSNDHAVGCRSDWTLYSQTVLLKLMLENRHLLQSSSTHRRGDGFKKVISSLLESELSYGERALRKRIKALPLEPPAELEKAAHVYTNFMSSKEDVDTQIRALTVMIPTLKSMDNPPKKTIGLSAGNKIVEQFIVVPSDFTQSDVTSKFSYKSDKLLIAEYYRLKTKFEDSKHRSAEVYGEILKVMHQKGYSHLSAKDLPRRMSTLASEFRMRKDRLKNTGNSSSDRNWVYWDDMELIWEGSVVHDPQKTRSMGSSHETEMRMGSGTVKVPSNAASKFLEPIKIVPRNNRAVRIEDMNSNIREMIQIMKKKMDS